MKDLVLQSMIRLLEPELKILCREDDVRDMENCIGDIEESYNKRMYQETEKEYTCNLTVINEKFLSEEDEQGCGGC